MTVVFLISLYLHCHSELHEEGKSVTDKQHCFNRQNIFTTPVGLRRQFPPSSGSHTSRTFFLGEDNTRNFLRSCRQCWPMLSRAHFVHPASFQPQVTPTLLGWVGGTGCHDSALQHPQVPNLCLPWGNNKVCKWEEKGAMRKSSMRERKWVNVSDWPLQEDFSLSLPLIGRLMWWVCMTANCLCLPVQELISVLQFCSSQPQWENYNQLAFLKQKVIVHSSDMTLMISDCFSHSAARLYL